MLRPITRVPCWPGLVAGFDLQLTLARWLCDAATNPASVAEPQVRALHPHAAVQEWLWSFLHPRADQTRLLTAAILVASHTAAERLRLLAWLDIVANVGAQFHANPPQWTAPPEDLPQWLAFKELMLAFYEKLNNRGLPFDSNGNPTAGSGVTYKQFVKEFLQDHSDCVCVVCGGYLGNVQVDHWIGKANYPALSIAPDNLLPMCHQCNESPGKGTKPVFAVGAVHAFEDWFHPYHRSGHGRVRLQYEPQRFCVVTTAMYAADDERTSNLDKLIKLSDRWTREFKAEYRKKQKEFRQLIAAGHLQRNRPTIDGELQRCLVALVEDSPHYHVHRVLLECVREPARLDAWLSEL